MGDIVRVGRSGLSGLLRRSLMISPCKCRECGEIVHVLDDVCPHCAALGPVQLPSWVGYILLGLVLRTFLITVC
jgi:hypothetical protein